MGTPSCLLPPFATALSSAHPPSLPPARAPLGCSSGRWGSGPSVPWLTGPFLFNTNWVWAMRQAGSCLCPLTPSCFRSDGLTGDRTDRPSRPSKALGWTQGTECSVPSRWLACWVTTFPQMPARAGLPGATLPGRLLPAGGCLWNRLRLVAAAMGAGQMSAATKTLPFILISGPGICRSDLIGRREACPPAHLVWALHTHPLCPTLSDSRPDLR